MLIQIDRRALLLGGLATLVVSPAQASAGVDRLILSHINAQRRRANVPALRKSSALDKAAKNYARVLARTGRLSHTADGSKMTDRARRVGYRFRFLAENIAFRSHSADKEVLAETFVRNWMQSSGHRRNLLSRKAKETGIGVATSGGKVYAVQLFGA